MKLKGDGKIRKTGYYQRRLLLGLQLQCLPHLQAHLPTEAYFLWAGQDDQYRPTDQHWHTKTPRNYNIYRYRQHIIIS
jgi:hypothetical protein